MSTTTVYDRIPRNYREALSALSGRKALTLGHKTKLTREQTGAASRILLTYWDTVIATYYLDGLLIATTGGWDTYTTKRRIKNATSMAWAPVEYAANGTTYWLTATEDTVDESAWQTVSGLLRHVLATGAALPPEAELVDMVDDLLEDMTTADPCVLAIALALADTRPSSYRRFLAVAQACW